ncbi:MAG: hypothetical protein LBO05_09415 [Deltaproteobacteria bacterium]|nr:hypothetical protein [Deltaproteobacteria bacterium]
MALRRYRHDWLYSLCAVFSMVAFLTPMLTVLGIRDGIVGTMTRRLLENPRNMELSPSGNRSFGPEFFDELRRHPDAAFLVPETRSISAAVNLAVQGRPSLDADLAATAPGDPIVAMAGLAFPEGRGLAPGEIFVSEAVAEKLGLAAGSELTGRAGRRRGGAAESASLPMTVLGVVPGHAVAGHKVFCSLPLEEMVEDYRTGYGVPELGWEGPENPSPGRLFARFRLYSKDLDGVGRLRAHLLTLDVETVTQAAQIELVKNLDRSFTVVFLALFAVVGGGAFASAASGSTDQVVKMRRSLAVLSLLGMGRPRLLFFTMSQASLTGALASIIASLLFLGLAAVLNAYFTGGLGGGEAVCSLAPWKLAAAGFLTTAFVTCASGCAYGSLAGIEPSEGMRDV